MRGCRPASRFEYWYRHRKHPASMRRFRRQWMNKHFVPEDFIVKQCYRCKFKSKRLVIPKALCSSCRKYLCSACVDIHKRSPITGKHEFLDVETTAKDNSEVVQARNKRNNRAGNRAGVLTNAPFSLEAKINIRSTEDKYGCWIMSSILLVPDLIVLADYSNTCLKIINISRDEIVSRYDLKELPWQPSTIGSLDVCKLSDDEIAVAMSMEHSIQFFTTKKDLKPGKRLEVGGRCTGVDYFEGKLAVLFYIPDKKIEIMTLEGKVLHRIANSPDKRLFWSPNTVKMSNEDGHLVLYYCDYMFTRKLTLDGKSEWFCMFGDTVRPRGACLLGRDQLLVCGILSNTVIMLPSLRDSLPTPVLDTKVCIQSPVTVNFCSEKRRLFVTSQNSNQGEDYLYIYRQK